MHIRFLILFLAFWLQSNAQLTYQQVWVQYDSAWTYKNLQLIPVRYRGAGAQGFYKQVLPDKFMSLHQGIKTGKVKVKEFFAKGDADVHILSIINNSDKTILINSGELIAGGKQDRMVGETKLIPPSKQEQYLNVFCVEEGRWDKKPKPFFYSGTADMDLRKVMDLTQRQVDIWRVIQQNFRSQNKQTNSWPYLQLDKEIGNADTAYKNFFNQKFAASDSSFAGFLAIAGDRILGTELFVTPALANNAWESALAGYIRSAIIRGSILSVDLKQMEAFMDSLLETETSQKKTLAQYGRAYKYDNILIGFIAYGF
jgi:hypothetical protein